MKHFFASGGRVLFPLYCTIVLSGCSGDDKSQSDDPDPAILAAAPDSTKVICDQVCTVADEIRAKACGTTEFTTHSECYAECVTRYLDYPNCKDDFDAFYECVKDAVCSAQTACTGDILMAAACMQMSQGTN